VLFHPRAYRLCGPIVIGDTTNVSLVGAGATLLLAPSARFGLRLAGVNQWLTILSLRIIGTGQVADEQTGIGTSVHPLSGTTAVGLRILNCEVANVVRGIYLSVSGSELGRLRHIRIEANTVHDIVGRDSGQGYGIALSGCRHSVVARNLVERTERHAIYNSISPFSWIAENVVREHRASLAHGFLLSAVVAARSSYVTIAGNGFDRCAGGAVSVEPHETDRAIASRAIQVLGNRFARSVHCDIWVGSSEPDRGGPLSDVVIAHNVFRRTPVHATDGCECIRIYSGVRIRVARNRFWVPGRTDRGYSLIAVAARPHPGYIEEITISDNVAARPHARGVVSFVALGSGWSAGRQGIRIERNVWTDDVGAGG